MLDMMPNIHGLEEKRDMLNFAFYVVKKEKNIMVIGISNGQTSTIIIVEMSMTIYLFVLSVIVPLIGEE